MNEVTIIHLESLGCIYFSKSIYDNQYSINIKVFQGERSKSTDNHLLGEFSISGIPPAPKGVSEVTECFEVDANGILTVTAAENTTGKMKKLTIINANGRLSKEEIEKMVNDAKKYILEDQEFKTRADAYNALEDCLYNVKNKIKEYNTKKTLEEMEKRPCGSRTTKLHLLLRFIL
ncbi:hypothetical protein L1987_12940 [Smallanthus sonchifolius]|uniref:Uncharacterized protein n=1 Tax=Smallanthus sonchifolius TaxID=185202 RepID=A0ACB9JHC3_9ASTR|nr:hypothetical protein L1987_12940 [Smallanthus sonchifolius]